MFPHLSILNHLINIVNIIFTYKLKWTITRRREKNYYKTKGKEQSYWGVKPDHQHCKFAIQNFICKGKQKKKKKRKESKKERRIKWGGCQFYLDSWRKWECFLGRSCPVKSLSLVDVMISISASSLLIQDSWNKGQWRLVIETKGNLKKG